MTARASFPKSTAIAPAPPGEPRLIAFVSVATMAQLLDLSETTIWDLVKRGHLPKPLRIGGSTRWDWQAVKNFLDSQGAPSPEQDDPILRASRGR